MKERLKQAELSRQEIDFYLENPHDKNVAPSSLPLWFQRCLVCFFWVAVLLGVAFVFIERWRRGGAMIGGAMLLLAVMRWVVDSSVLGVLSVRSQKFDSFFCTVIGGIMLFLTFSVDTLGS